MDWNSPFIIPVAAFVMVLGIVIANAMHRYYVRKLQSDERMAAIARGLALPPEPIQPAANTDPKYRASKARSTGIILIGVGLGIIVGMSVIAYVTRDHEALAGCIGGIIPLFIGLGMLVDYALQVRDLRRDEDNARSSAPSQS